MKRKDYKKLLAAKRRKQQVAKMAILGMFATGVSGVGLTSPKLLNAFAAEVEVGARAEVTGMITYVDASGQTKTIPVKK